MIIYEIVGALVFLGLVALGVIKAREYIRKPKGRKS